jgi:hypothetical protein
MTVRWVEHRIPQAVTEPPKPDVTSPEWVEWFERSVWDGAPAAAEPTPEPPPLVPAAVRAPAPARASYPRPPTAVLAAACVVALALLALVVVAGWWWAGRDEPDPNPQARQVDGRSRQHAPAPPVPVTVGERHTQVRVLASGDLVVEDWVRKPGGSLTHRMYELNGALESTGSRGLVRLEPVAMPASSDRTISVVGATVLSLACAPTSGDVPVPCGEDAGPRGWHLVGPAATPDAEVLVQVDLPS